MFTVERDDTSVKVVVVDETAQHEDIELFIERDGRAFVRQFDEQNNYYEILIMSRSQLFELLGSISSLKEAIRNFGAV